MNKTRRPADRYYPQLAAVYYAYARRETWSVLDDAARYLADAHDLRSPARWLNSAPGALTGAALDATSRALFRRWNYASIEWQRRCVALSLTTLANRRPR